MFITSILKKKFREWEQEIPFPLRNILIFPHSFSYRLASPQSLLLTLHVYYSENEWRSPPLVSFHRHRLLCYVHSLPCENDIKALIVHFLPSFRIWLRVWIWIEIISETRRTERRRRHTNRFGTTKLFLESWTKIRKKIRWNSTMTTDDSRKPWRLLLAFWNENFCQKIRGNSVRVLFPLRLWFHKINPIAFSFRTYMLI